MKFSLQVFLVLSLLMLFGIAPMGFNAQSLTLYKTISTYHHNYNCGLQKVGAGSTIYVQSPVSAVNEYNMRNAPNFLVAPQPVVSAPLTQYYFTTNSAAYIGGDQCLDPLAGKFLDTVFNVYATVLWGPSQIAHVGGVNTSLSNVSDVYANTIAFSPQVNGQISDAFNTNSYIFDQIPQAAQRIIWTWSAPYANLSFGSGSQLAGAYILNGIHYTADSCNIKYNYQLNVTISNVSNSFVNFNEVTPGVGDGYTVFEANVLPYLLDNFSMPSLYLSNMNLSYDIFSPYNYYTPSTNEDTLPINTSSGMFASCNGVLYIMSNNGCGNGKSNVGDGTGTDATGSHPSFNIINPISIAVAPNDYVYVLNQSNGNYYIDILRMEAKGYFNTSNYAPTNISFANSWPNGLIPQPHEAIGLSNWANTWNGYWSNVISLQNYSAYVINTINLQNYLSTYATAVFDSSICQNDSYCSSGSGLSFAPLNISVDSRGDIFVTGSLNDENGDTWPGIFEITNTLGGGLVEFLNTTANYSINNRDVALPEIAASPGGLLAFVAGPQQGYVYGFGGLNLSKISTLSLAYQNITSSAPGQSAAVLNITYWLSHQGLYNQSLPWIETNNYNTNEDTDAAGFHHPLALQDTNGYLYVLDQWSGALGMESYWTQCGVNACAVDQGIFFDMLMLRALNSTGSEVPLAPTFFPDMAQQYSCTTPRDLQQCTRSAGNQCQTANPGLNCVPEASSCGSRSQEATFTCVNPASHESAYYSLATANYYGVNTYPPFGWILTANITAASLSCGYINGQCAGGFNGKDHTMNCAQVNGHCGNDLISINSNEEQWCNPNCGQSNPIPGYYGYYQPIGPAIEALPASQSANPQCSPSPCIVHHENNVSIGYVPFFGRDSFAANENDSLTLFFGQGSVPFSWFGQSNADVNYSNQYIELLTTNFNIDNYTNLFTGRSPYVCYVADNSAPVNGCTTMNGGGKSDTLNYISPPVYLESNPFYYNENLGARQDLNYESSYYSAFTAGSGGNGKGNSPQESGACITEIAEGLQPGSGCFGESPSQIAGDLPYTGINQGYGQGTLSLGQEYLTNHISGSVIVPYQYNETIQQNYTCLSGCGGSSGGGGTCTLPANSTINLPIFTFASVGVKNPNKLTSIVQGGSTYLEMSGTSLYKPNLTDLGLILPPQFAYSILTNRDIGNLYINITQNKDTNEQSVLNATNQTEYRINVTGQGTSGNPEAYGAYEQIFTNATAPPKYGPQYAGFPHIDSTANDNFSYQATSNFGTIPIFNWYKQMSYENILALAINKTGTTSGTLGYTRFLVVLTDIFNNVIYAPIDADVANLTTIDLSVRSIVNATNANQTLLAIAGNVFYGKNFGESRVPLANGEIYLYYNTNLNYLNYNVSKSTGQLLNATLCTYGISSADSNSMMPVPTNCQYANPIWTGYQYNDNKTTYNPSFNDIAGTSCNPPPASLLANTTFNCNIYGEQNLPAVCPRLPDGNQQFCDPVFAANGTGLCTSQLGLIAIVKTNSSGFFHYNTTACGTGEEGVTARFYGSPAPQPISADQPLLGYSANPQAPSADYLKYEVINYTWAPNTTSTNFGIGLFELPYGQIDFKVILISIFTLIALLIVRKSIDRYLKYESHM